MSALELVQAGGRGLDRRLDSVPAQALLSGLRAAGAVSEPEAAALGRPGGSGWTRRLRALAVAKGDRTCRVLLDVLEGLEGPPRPGPFDFYDPHRDAAPSHRSDCPCCRPEPHWTPQEEEEGPPKNGPEDDEGPRGEEGPEDEEGDPENEEENPEEEPKNPEDDEGGGEEGPEDDEGPQGEEGPEDEEGEPENEEENPEDDEGGGGDEDPEDDEGGGGGGDED